MIIIYLLKLEKSSSKYHGILESWALESDTFAFKSIMF